MQVNVDDGDTSEAKGGMSVDWSFRFRDTPSDESPTRWGHMAVAKDFSEASADNISALVRPCSCRASIS